MQLTRALKYVLIGERGRGIDAVHDRVRLVAQQQLKQQAALEHRLRQITVEVSQHERAMLGAAQHDGDLEPRDGRRHEDVAPLDVDRHRAAVGIERASGGAHLVLEQRHEHQPPRRRLGAEHASRDGVADEATAAEQHYRPIIELHAVARSLRSPGG